MGVTDEFGLPIIGLEKVDGYLIHPDRGMDSAGGILKPDHVRVVLKGGLYGEKGMLICVHKDSVERVVMVSTPDNRMNPGMGGTVTQVRFVPSHEKPPPGGRIHAIWRAKAEGTRVVSN